MAININPNRINVQSGNVGRGKTDGNNPNAGNARPVIPAKADVNIIPAPESLQTMIRSAVDAMRSNVFWERGTILNLVV